MSLGARQSEHLDRKHFEIIVNNDVKKKQPDSLEDVLSNVSTEINEASSADLKENFDDTSIPSTLKKKKPQ